jgi:hypothetical protein
MNDQGSDVPRSTAVHPTVRGFEVDFTGRAICTMQYAKTIVATSYAAASDFRGWCASDRQSSRFSAPVRQQIPQASRSRRGLPGKRRQPLFRCGTRYNVVRCFGYKLFAADLGRPGLPTTGPRKNDRVSTPSRNCRFKDVRDA